MNLYQINVIHYAEKDNHESIENFVVAKDDEAVYNWFQKAISNCWNEENDEEEMFDIYDGKNDEIIGQETYKQKIIRIKGDMNDEDYELTDLYYGETLYGWEKIKSNIKEQDIEILKKLKIPVEVYE